MNVAAGTRIGPYEILSAIGAGGMGEVYRARDSKLNRDVAIKVLLPSVVADADRIARFQREARVLASLNHPNIANIYGTEEAPGITALVLELVEGEDLAERIARGPIPLDEALPIARQIAGALEAAHELGVIHRDLKPANVKVRPDGTVKVLDFGLAKATDPPGSTAAAAVANSPTLTSPAMMTGVGVILGTAAYMSPEQAKGRVADKRSDVWAFGCVLYETLTGTRAFPGEDISDTLANVLKSEPDWTALPAATPRAVRTLLRRCLTKDRARRLDSATAVALDIDDVIAASGADSSELPAPTPMPRWRNALRVCAAIGVIAVSLVAGYSSSALKPATALPVTRLAITLADGVQFSNPTRHLVALSPDGTRVVYAANNRLYHRALNALNASPIAGIEGTGYTSPRGPFFSPDGQWVGFWQGGQLKKVSINGGAPITLCAVSDLFGTSWAHDNTILLGRSDAGIWRVSGNGGSPEPLIKMEPGQRAFNPQLLPNSRSVLFTVAQIGRSWEEAQIVVQSLDSGARRSVITGASDGRYLPTGHLVYALRGTVLAVRFDPVSLSVGSGPVTLIEEVEHAPGPPNFGGGTGASQFSVSSQGTVAYLPLASEATSGRTLVWVDREGHEQATEAPMRRYLYPRLDPSGTRLALDVQNKDDRDIWVWNFLRKTLTPLRVGPSRDRLPLWTPDGKRIIFNSDQPGAPNLFWQAASGSGVAEKLTDSNPGFAHTISPDGKRLVVRQMTEGIPDLTILDATDGHGAASSPYGNARSLIGTSAAEENAEISPNGQWLAYQSNKSGAVEVYVTPFPNVQTGQTLVSTAGGTEPLWSRDGRELFYRDPTGAVMGVSVTPGAIFAVGQPVRLVENRSYALGASLDGPLGGDFSGLPYRTYEVSPEGKRFLMIKSSSRPQNDAASRIVIVQNWFEELKAKVNVAK